MSTSITFWNHACIEIALSDGSLLCDPWFSGRVYNDAWELLEETDIQALVLGRIRHVWISQEQPDHLHLSTLRQIRAGCSQPITVYFRESADATLTAAVRALGYQTQVLRAEVPVRLDDDSEIWCYPTRASSALVVRHRDEVILNQSDCALGRSAISRLLARHGKVDVWCYQFSPPGRPTRDDDRAALARAGRSRLRRIARYLRWLRPRVFVPFASFVRYCHPRNLYLNRWRVTPDRLLQDLPFDCTTLRLLRPGDIVLADGTHDVPDATAAVSYWRNLFGKVASPRTLTPIAVEALDEVGRRSVAQIATIWPRLAVPGRVFVQVDDLRLHAMIDCRAGTFALSEQPTSPPIAVLDASTLMLLLRYPWGASTIDMASTVNVRDAFRWRWLLSVRQVDHQRAHLGRWRAFLPLALAMFSTMRGRFHHASRA